MQPPDPDHRLPRLYIDASLRDGETIALSADQTHYLKTVLRRPEDASLRVFNGHDGEWVGRIRYTGKKDSTLTLERQTRPQGSRPQRLHLIFAPIKKDRMDFMIEKAVELGVTDLHPVLTQYTMVRDVNPERVSRQIIEAAEQCERLDLPTLHPLVSLQDWAKSVPKALPVFAALERADAPHIGTIAPVPAECAVLIGPEGGFSEDEQHALTGRGEIKAVSLGDQILRSETAALFALTALSVNFTK